MKDEAVVALALEAGFTAAAAIAPADMQPLEDVRAMCASGRCPRYGRCWTCPPACGTLEQMTLRLRSFPRGVLAQTTGTLEDCFDYDSMQAAQRANARSLQLLAERLSEHFGRVLPMGAGGCLLCPSCAYPDAPCRRPGQSYPAMEAYGLLVSRECQRCDLKYCYGPDTMTFVCCVLFGPQTGADIK